MRNNSRDENREDWNRDDRNREPRWLHGHHHGQNSDHGNYTVDTHFNRGYGDNRASQYGDNRSFNSNADHWQMYPEGRFQSGGARYSGEDNAQSFGDRNNPYGMTYTKGDGYNSDRHYDARADYSNKNYDDADHQGVSHYRYGMANERFGHDVARGDRNEAWLGHSSRGDYESYRRYEHGNDMYDNDYSGGFSGRNYTHGRSHYGEDSSYSNMARWQGRRGDQNKNRYDER